MSPISENDKTVDEDNYNIETSFFASSANYATYHLIILSRSTSTTDRSHLNDNCEIFKTVTSIVSQICSVLSIRQHLIRFRNLIAYNNILIKVQIFSFRKNKLSIRMIFVK